MHISGIPLTSKKICKRIGCVVAFRPLLSRTPESLSSLVALRKDLSNRTLYHKLRTLLNLHWATFKSRMFVKKFHCHGYKDALPEHNTAVSSTNTKITVPIEPNGAVKSPTVSVGSGSSNNNGKCRRHRIVQGCGSEHMTTGRIQCKGKKIVWIVRLGHCFERLIEQKRTVQCGICVTDLKTSCNHPIQERYHCCDNEFRRERY